MTRALVLGAGGIVGQHMILSKPSNLEVMFTRHDPDCREPWTHLELDATGDPKDTIASLNAISEFAPDVIVNLAGENRVDVVEQDPRRYDFLNATFPGLLARYCERHEIRLIHGSTQGVFSGDEAPYATTSAPNPLTEYGKQKMLAEVAVMEHGATIARLTFVLGVRPFPDVGRRNPLEEMLDRKMQFQVNDRWFSPLMAEDAAAQLWRLVRDDKPPALVHLGEPLRTTRYLVCCELAWRTGADIIPIAVPHEFFPGIAPRPFDTHWGGASRYQMKLRDGVWDAYTHWKERNGSRLTRS